jgi:hypothetical protein
MARSGKYHVVAAFGAASVMARDVDWSRAVNEVAESSSELNDFSKLLRQSGLLPAEIETISESATRNFQPQYQQINQKKAGSSSLPSPPKFTDAHLVNKSPTQLVIFPDEFETAGEAVEWTTSAKGRTLTYHADYVTVLFMGV